MPAAWFERCHDLCAASATAIVRSRGILPRYVDHTIGQSARYAIHELGANVKNLSHAILLLARRLFEMV